MPIKQMLPFEPRRRTRLHFRACGLLAVAIFVALAIMGSVSSHAGNPQTITMRLHNATQYRCAIKINRAEYVGLPPLAPGEHRVFRLALPSSARTFRVDAVIWPAGHGKSNHAQIEIIRSHGNAIIGYKRTGPREWDGQLSVKANR